MTGDELYEHIISPPWGWFKTIAYELGILRTHGEPCAGSSEPTFKELFWDFFCLTVMLWTVLGRPVDEEFCTKFVNGELRLHEARY